MKISNNWLKDFINTDLSSDKISEYLTDIGLEVEGVENFESIKGSLNGIVVGKVLTCEKHPNADKLNITTVDVGSEQALQIVCGAPNVAAGQIVPVAPVGTILYDKAGNSFDIKKAKIRGEVSEGMICAEDELGLSDDHGGIMVLNESYKVGDLFSNYFDISQDEVYEIGLTPNRTDAMSHYGVARDLNAFLASNQLKSDFKKFEIEEWQGEGDTNFKIEIENEQLVPRYLAAVVDHIKVSESPNWLKDRLKAIGLNSINNVVDITNYVLHGLGQPLHAFDAAEIKSDKIIVGPAAEGSKFTTLDGVERTLNGSEIMIKDGSGKPLCIAGVFGGENSGVNVGTTKIVLESAYFNPVAVRKAAKFHGLNTDASFRFERGIDIKTTRKALFFALKLIKEICGGTLVGNVLEYYPNEISNHYMLFRYSKLDKILGMKIHRAKVKEILKFLEIEILNEITDGLELSVPTYRADVTREIDVIEEVLRIYGYNKVKAPEKFSFSPVSLNLDDRDALENSWARLLQSQGFNEVMNNSLRSVKDESNAVKLLNPLSSDLAFMRISLLDGLLENAAYNINRKNPDLKFFELGKIYYKSRANDLSAEHPEKKFEERKQLGLLVSGRNHAENWLLPKSSTHFFNLKSYVFLLLEKLKLDFEEIPLQDERFSEGLELKFLGQTLAKLGKVSAKYLKAADISQDAFYAEIELENCDKLRSKDNFKFKDIPKFNKIRRDLALLLDREISYVDLYSVAMQQSSKYLKNINLFDVYEGEKLPAGKKSYALSFELLNEEKTLEEKEISAVMNQLIKTFQTKFKAELR